MHNIANLTAQIAQKSKELVAARNEDDIELIERLEDELYELEEELAEESEIEDAKHGKHGWQ